MFFYFLFDNRLLTPNQRIYGWKQAWEEVAGSLNSTKNQQNCMPTLSWQQHQQSITKQNPDPKYDQTHNFDTITFSKYNAGTHQVQSTFHKSICINMHQYASISHMVQPHNHKTTHTIFTPE